MYVPYIMRNVPNAKKERCSYLIGELGKTTCSIYGREYRIGLEVADHVYCGFRNENHIIPGCTYFTSEPSINKTINIRSSDI